MRISTLSLSALALLLVVSAGCGGSSSASNGFPSTPSSVGNPIGPGIDGGSTLQLLAAGQTWRYAVSGTITKDYLNSALAKQTMTGAISNGILVRVVTAAPAPFTGNTFEVTDTFTYTLQGGTPTVETTTRYLSQGGDGSVYLVGADNYGLQTESAANTVPVAPGAFSSSTNLTGNVGFPVYNPTPVSITVTSGSGASLQSATYTFLPGDANFQTAFTALGQESVPSTTGAAYTAWKTQATETDTWDVNGLWRFYDGLAIGPGFVISSTVTRSSVDDWCPAIGAPVRSQVTLNERDLVSTAFTTNTPTPTVSPTITYTEVNLNKSETLKMSLIARS